MNRILHTTITLILAGLSLPVVADDAPPTPSTTLSKITVKDADDSDYVVPNTSVASKIDAPVIDTPVSISTVSRGLMDDRQVPTLLAVAESTSGVVNRRDSWGLGFQEAFEIRGFSDPGSGYYYDGLRVDALTAETDNLETVEIAKGPASALYGNESSEGGVVNLDVKHPLADARYELKGTGGSFNYFKGVIDATASLNATGTLRYRFVGASTSEGSFIDLGGDRRRFGAASLEWVPSAATRVLIRQEYDRLNYNPSEGAPYYSDTGIIDMPIHVNDIGPANYQTTLRITRLDWSHSFGGNWAISQRNQYDRNVWDYKVIAQFPADPVTSQRRYAYAGQQPLSNEAHNVDLTGTVRTGPVEHKLLLGVDYRHYRQDFVFTSTNGYFPPFDFTNPDYFAGFTSWADVAAHGTPGASVSEKSVHGLYFQDMASLTDRVRLMVGGGFDRVNSRSAWAWNGTLADANAMLAASDGSDRAFSPRVGLLYKLRTDWSIYASYATGFSTNNGFSWSGSKLDPCKTKSYEIGMKNEWRDGAITSSVAAYDITKSNILLPDPAHLGFNLNSGHVRSRGVDLDLTGRITEHWSTTSALGYGDVFTLDDNSIGLAGTKLPLTRAWRGSVWTKYQFGPSAEEGLSLGGGVFFASKANLFNWATSTNYTYSAPAWRRVDLAAIYGWKVPSGRVKAQLNVNNALDTRYVDSYYYAAPRNIMFSVDWTY